MRKNPGYAEQGSTASAFWRGMDFGRARSLRKIKQNTADKPMPIRGRQALSLMRKDKDSVTLPVLDFLSDDEAAE